MKRWFCLVLLMVGLLGLPELAQAGEILIQGKQLAASAEKIRAFHFVLRHVSLDRARWMVDLASDSGFNTVQVTITDGVTLDNSPWKPAEDAWSKEEFISWIVYAKQHGLVVVPELQLLTHQEKFLQSNYPELMFAASEYNPKKEEVYRKVFRVLDELINVMHPTAFHIGHDELASKLPSDLFLADVQRIYAYLKRRGVTTWMWGDMLISQDEFGSGAFGQFQRLPPGFGFHNIPQGYGKAIRDKLPRDIVICDWHYNNDSADFPSLERMVGEGFKVIGTTFRRTEAIRDFSRYAEQHGAYGMMATTWFFVQRREWDVVERIIRESGSIYSRDFPDAK